MNPLMRSRHAALLAAVLAGCGGGPSDPAVPLEVPESATKTAEGFTDFVRGVTEGGEASAPVSLDKLARPPASETAEPARL